MGRDLLSIRALTLSSPVLIAPLAGYTNLPTRSILRPQGASLLFTEMVSSEGLFYNYQKSVGMIDSHKEDSPLGVQLFGAKAERIASAFRSISHLDFDWIDINCGCPVRKILKSCSGAYLLQNPDEIYRIVKALRDLTDKPLSIKIRSGWDNSTINFPEVMEAGVKGGIDCLIFHPRTRAMMFTGHSNWEFIKEMKASCPVPVIGNGDIFTGEDARQMMDKTGCDAVMLARGVIENPFLVEEVMASLSGKTYIPPDLERRVETLLLHASRMVSFYGERRGLIEFRKFFRGYLKGYPHISPLRKEVNETEDLLELEKAVRSYLSAYKDYQPEVLP